MKTILVVDDDGGIRQLISTYIHDFTSHKVIAAEDGDAAIDILKATVPDLIILDMVLPNIGGTALYQDIRNFEPTKETPIIFISGVITNDKLKQEIIDMGAEAYFSKPLVMQDLLDKIKSVLDEVSDSSSE